MATYKGYPSILDSVNKYAPRPMKTTNNTRSKYWIRCPMPGHDDKNASMSISEDGGMATCWSACGQFTRKTFLQSLTGHLDENWLPVKPVVPKILPQLKKKTDDPKKKAHGCTLQQLADSKGFDVDYLKELGWADTYYPGSRVKAVYIPYWDQNRSNPVPRYRVNLTGNPKYWWQKGATLQPYGLWELRNAQEADYIVIVEGETDYVTLTRLGIPCIGIPGNTTWRMLWTVYLARISNVYVWREPGKINEHTGKTPGDVMCEDISRSVDEGHIFAIDPPLGAKDATDIAQKYGDQAEGMIRQLIEEAKPYITPKTEEEVQTEARADARMEAKRKSTPTTPAAGQEIVDADTGSDDRDSVALALPKHITDDQADPHYGHDFHFDWESCHGCKEIHVHRRAFAAETGRPDSQTGEVKAHRDHLLKLLRRRGGKNAEFLTGRYGEKLCILMENPNLFIDEEWLLLLLRLTVGDVDSDGNEIGIYKQASECGLPCKWNCVTDGTRFTGKIKCRCHFCQGCPTELGRNLARLKLPNLEGEARYCETWLYTEHQLPENIALWSSHLQALMLRWEKEVAKLGRRKANKGNVYFRAIGVYYTGNVAKIHWKVMIYEETSGDADAGIDRLCRVMEAEVDSQRRYVDGETAVLQIVEDSMSHLVGIDDQMYEDTQSQIFAAHYFACKGRHIFQGLGALHAALRQLPPPDPLACDVCGGPLTQIIDRQERPDNGHTSPTSPNYMWPPKPKGV